MSNAYDGLRRAALLVAFLTAVVGPTDLAHARKGYVASYVQYVGGAPLTTVASFETSTNGVIGSPITVGSSPIWVAFAPDGKRAYVANQGSGTVSVIDTAKDTVMATVATGAGATGVGLTPDGSRAYVGNVAAGTVSVIDTETNSVIKTIAVGTGPLAAIVTPDGGRVYVTDFLGGRVFVIDSATNTVAGPSIAVGVLPTAIVFTPDGRRGYVVNQGSNTVSVLDPATNTVVKTLNVGQQPGLAVVSPDGSRAYVVNEVSNSYSVIDTATDTVGATVASGTAPRGIALTPDGARIYLALWGESRLSVIDAASNELVGTVGGFIDGALNVSLTPDQGPAAAFTASPARAGKPTSFDASGSSDPDGTVSRYDWDFGDGQTSPNGGPTPSHTYVNAGTYDVSLTVTDNEGCSTTQVNTGVTVYCNGSSAARKGIAVTIDGDGPAVKVKSPRKNQSIRRKRFKKIRGTASDPAGVRKVQYALGFRTSSGSKRKSGGRKRIRARCLYLKNNGRLRRNEDICTHRRYLTAKGTTSWSARINKRLPRGRYMLYVRATDAAGNKSEAVQVSFRLV